MKTTPQAMPHVDFVPLFRAAAPYIHAFGGQTFVIAFGGEVVSDGLFVSLTHDLNLLQSLNVRLVLVHGARPQIEATLAQRQLSSQYHGPWRVTDPDTLTGVMQAVGQMRVQIEALLSMGLPQSPMAGASIRVASGNFVTARPLGVMDGVDLQHTGAVRKVDAAAIAARLAAEEMVLISPLGYSATGEIFNLTLEDVATACAIALQADKLIFLMDAPGVCDASGELLRELTAQEAEAWGQAPSLSPDARLYLPCAVQAVREGVGRAHLIDRHRDGALLEELFTLAGVGSMVTRDPLVVIRQASVEDLGGILALIEPLEQAGVLVKRNRELLEMEIRQFSVLEHDGVIAGCAVLHAYPQAGMAELGCLVVNPLHRGQDYGELLLKEAQKRARQLGLQQLFVLTTQTAHWFIEHGFVASAVEALPLERQNCYNYQRRSKVFVQRLI